MAENNANNHILIGLGGTGGKVLKAFKKRWYREFPSEKSRRTANPYIGFLYVDSTKEMMNEDRTDPSWKVLGQDATFDTDSEFVNIQPTGGISELLDHIDTYPNLKYIVKSAELMRKTIGRIETAAGQKRRAGRIMFASKIDEFMRLLNDKESELRRVTGMADFHIHIFTGLAGGTGSGSIVDVVTQCRIKFGGDVKIDVHAMIPEKVIPSKPNSFDSGGRYHPNGYAALRELSALNVGKFVPCDVYRGEEHARFPNPDAHYQFGLMLYSNENSNGFVVDSIDVLPELVADAMYFRIFMPDNKSTQQLYRAWSCENIESSQVEYDIRPNRGNEPMRTKYTNTFGIKRIVYPESRIMEHISYTMCNSIIRQMRYNNFSEEDLGYMDEPQKRNYDEMLFGKNGFLTTWKLDEPHLMLEENIVKTDEEIQPFETFWKDTVTFYNHDDACRFSPQPLDYLDGYCSEKFNGSRENNSYFRKGRGVADYFVWKASAEQLKEQAGTIIDAIEQDLFTKWAEGSYSMYDLAGICDSILKHINTLLNQIDKDLTVENENIESCTTTRDALKAEYNAAGLVTRFVGLLGGRAKPEIYSDYQMESKDLYIAKTRKEAKEFERKLLVKLQEAFDNFSKEVVEFISKLLICQETLDQEITARSMKSDELDLQAMVVEVREPQKIKNFENKLLRDQNKMRTLANEVRKALTNDRKIAHFHDIAKGMNKNTLIDVADEVLSTLVMAWHNDQSFTTEKIVGMNVIEQLKKFFDSHPDQNITTFADRLVAQSGVFLHLNEMELKKQMGTNEKPEVKKNIGIEFKFVSMPKCEGNTELETFRDELEIQLGKKGVIFDFEGSKDNEITVISVVSCFPIRALDWLRVYKEKYDKMISGGDEMSNRLNRILFHSEDDGSDLPLLEGEGEGPKGSQLIPYLLINAALEKSIRWGIDKREEEGWCSAVVDILGNAELELMSTKFTELVLSEKFTPEFKNQIVDEVDKFLKDEDLTQSMRKATADKIMELVKNRIVKEIGVGTSLYKEYLVATEEAVKMVTKKQ